MPWLVVFKSSNSTFTFFKSLQSTWCKSFGCSQYLPPLFERMCSSHKSVMRNKKMGVLTSESSARRLRYESSQSGQTPGTKSARALILALFSFGSMLSRWRPSFRTDFCISIAFDWGHLALEFSGFINILRWPNLADFKSQ